MNTDAESIQAVAMPAVAPAPAKRSRGWKWLGIAAVLIALVGATLWWLLAGQYRETTEDAYVDGNVVAVTAQVSGVVTAIGADDTDYVKAGSDVVTLDDTDARLSLARAEALLARSVEQVDAQAFNWSNTAFSVRPLAISRICT